MANGSVERGTKLVGFGLGRFLAVCLVGVYAIAISAASTESPAGWRVWPENPTSIDFVEVRYGDQAGRSVQALKAVEKSTFYAVVHQGQPSATRYSLGVLPPGDYTFVLYEAVTGRGCSYQPVVQLSFTVHGVKVPSSLPGAITLLVKAASREAVGSLIDSVGLSFERILGNWMKVEVIPGLERHYLPIIASWPEVVTVGPDRLGYVPECPPPLGKAVYLGRLLIEFQADITVREAEILAHRLPPKLIRWELGCVPGEPDLGRAVVEVPPGTEAVFLARYLQQEKVLGGAIGVGASLLK